MGWSIGFDSTWQRDIGYGVPAYCDHPDCHAEIDRGLSYVCGGEPYGGDLGCGLYFCETHHGHTAYGLCDRCDAAAAQAADVVPFTPKPEHPRWLRWVLGDDSWAQWRTENPDKVRQYEKELADD